LEEVRICGERGREERKVRRRKKEKREERSGGEKGKWNKRRLSKLIARQSGRGR
jgi:hypothetical protein